jgi:hypothetical protein
MKVMTSRMASCDMYRRASLFISAVSELWTFIPVMNNGL